MRHSQEQLALLLALRLLQDLIDREKLAGVPLSVREQAAVVLRHYPNAKKISLLYEKLKEEK